ncbi:MAG: hypothetical protein JW833_13095, partial [Prolixibacteraceae bacterium]|nr:hypothetical protein [Prolixibacteraceae bacterium]
MSKLKHLFFFVFALPVLVQAQNDFYVNFSPGIDFIPPLPLWVNQGGYENLFLWADYEAAPLKSPLYYSYRLGFFNQAKGWEMEMNHLKIYLKNTTEKIERFSVSHGYNQFFINRVYSKRKIGIKLGFGIVLAHAENTIRGKKLDEGKGLFG